MHPTTSCTRGARLYVRACRRTSAHPCAAAAATLVRSLFSISKISRSRPTDARMQHETRKRARELYMGSGPPAIGGISLPIHVCVCLFVCGSGGEASLCVCVCVCARSFIFITTARFWFALAGSACWEIRYISRLAVSVCWGGSLGYTSAGICITSILQSI